jgi:anti-sigma28 factor (negative regulator of flagellin synthesis)
MKIHDQGNGGSFYQGISRRVDQPKVESANSSAVGSTELNESSQVKPVAREQSQLLAQLRSEPEIRQDLVARIKERVSSGEYLTRKAAEKTAESLLGS